MRVALVTSSHEGALGSPPQGHVRAGAVGRGLCPIRGRGRGPAAGLKNLPVGLGVLAQQAGYLGLQGQQRGVVGGAARGHDALDGVWFFWRPVPP